MRMIVGADDLLAGREATLRFALHHDGHTETEFSPRDGAALHLTVVRADLRDYQHIHPELDAARGEFSVRLTFPRAGPFSLLADVTPRDGEPTIVRQEVTVGGGEVTLRPRAVDDGPREAGGYTVTPEVASPLVSGVDLMLLSTVTKGGEPVADLKSTSDGARGSAIILREGTLEVVRAQPADRGGHGGMLNLERNQIAFATKLPQPGRYVVFQELRPEGTPITVANVYDVVAPPEGAAAEQPPDAMTHEMGDGSTMTGAMQTIRVEAYQWGFEPSTIRVKQGTNVQLLLTTRDVPHGFNLLDFDVAATILPGQTATATFVADKRGTFTFGCDVACGTGHPKMQESGGTLIVE